jgi:hypothetical protein
MTHCNEIDTAVTAKRILVVLWNGRVVFGWNYLLIVTGVSERGPP